MLNPGAQPAALNCITDRVRDALARLATQPGPWSEILPATFDAALHVERLSRFDADTAATGVSAYGKIVSVEFMIQPPARPALIQQIGHWKDLHQLAAALHALRLDVTQKGGTSIIFESLATDSLLRESLQSLGAKLFCTWWSLPLEQFRTAAPHPAIEPLSDAALLAEIVHHQRLSRQERCPELWTLCADSKTQHAAHLTAVLRNPIHRAVAWHENTKCVAAALLQCQPFTFPMSGGAGSCVLEPHGLLLDDWGVARGEAWSERMPALLAELVRPLPPNSRAIVVNSALDQTVADFVMHHGALPSVEWYHLPLS
jgi:hypothetical protein